MHRVSDWLPITIEGEQYSTEEFIARVNQGYKKGRLIRSGIRYGRPYFAAYQAAAVANEIS